MSILPTKPSYPNKEQALPNKAPDLFIPERDKLITKLNLFFKTVFKESQKSK